jgi:iron complex outermembrane receptor protein
MKVRREHAVSVALMVATGMFAAYPGSAEGEENRAGGISAEHEISEIIVTARKRDETAISVPVVVSVLGGAELERRGITSMDSLARAVPNLTIGDSGSGLQGGIVGIRGLSGADLNSLGDQAVSFNIDGVQIAKASIRRMGEMDMTQVEVLKGPQALFFGKNSPAGVVSIRTADPTRSLDGGFTAGYEANAREARATGYLSGPVNDSLGVRFAGMISNMSGWAERLAPESGIVGSGTVPNIFGPSTSRAPDAKEYSGRVTLRWEPTKSFNAKFKLTYNKLSGTSATAGIDIVNCPLGTPQGSTSLDNCKADGRLFSGELGPNFGAVNPAFGNGNTYLRADQSLAGLELNYQLTDALTLTSMTGLYHYGARSNGILTQVYFESGAPPRQILGITNEIGLREASQELRLRSDYSGRFNFMVGGSFQDTDDEVFQTAWRNALKPAFVVGYRFRQKGQAYSVFGQAMIDVLPKLELSAGGRASREKKDLPVALNQQTATSGLTDLFGPNYERSKTWSNFSPETTLTYRPSGDLTIYTSYKKGFLSGGFNANPTAQTGPGGSTLLRSDYGPQETSGFEAGVKASLFNGNLRTNFALYDYETKGLQVSVTIGAQVELRNAASARTRGAEFDFNWRAPVQGLTVNGALAYNDGKYLDYQASCYRGESSALCFNQINRALGSVALLQDLSGQRLARAPELTANLGFNYDTPLSEKLMVGLSADVSHVGGQFTDTINAPGGYLKAYRLVDATLRISRDESWELALIGRNLTDEHVFQRSTDIPFTGSAPGASLNGTLSDTGAYVSRGREVWLRASYEFRGPAHP